jgi:hypothetical protein
MTTRKEKTMEETVQARLELLRKEFEAGQQRLVELEGQHKQVAETMLRISGAIQVLEELTGERPLEEPTPNGTQAQERAKAAAR